MTCLHFSLYKCTHIRCNPHVHILAFRSFFVLSTRTYPHRYGNSRATWDHTVLPATRQRWHSRPYPIRSWYSIKRRRRDARLSWPIGWLHTKIIYTPKTVTHPSTNRAGRGLTLFVRRTPLIRHPYHQHQPCQSGKVRRRQRCLCGGYIWGCVVLVCRVDYWSTKHDIGTEL